MSRAATATPIQNLELFPDSLADWRDSPEETFAEWLATYGMRPAGATRSLLSEDAVDMASMVPTTLPKFREKSVTTYTNIFGQWIGFLRSRHIHWLEARRRDVRDFFEDAHPDMEEVSRLRYMQLLQKVYRHVKDLGWQGVDPMGEAMKAEPIVLDVVVFPPGLSAPQLAKTIQTLEQLEGWKGHRDRGAAALLLGAGLRANELIRLGRDAVSPQYEIHIPQIDTVHPEHTTLILPDGPWRTWYHAWVDERRRIGLPGELFCPASRQGACFSPSGLYRRVSTWLSGIEEDLPQEGPNLLRNTFAQQALRCGRYATFEVQRFLGHKEARTTLKHKISVSFGNLPG
ncbi:hypothetical protein [Paraburkholderia sp. A3RO-2L]|jgi:site-specific recombinase XerD|uniref:hypothetical protein n=1 Tax=unclassified Paraburkholderia TaxID=2615204 RepID=UPI003DA85FD6